MTKKTNSLTTVLSQAKTKYERPEVKIDFTKTDQKKSSRIPFTIVERKQPLALKKTGLRDNRGERSAMPISVCKNSYAFKKSHPIRTTPRMVNKDDRKRGEKLNDISSLGHGQSSHRSDTNSDRNGISNHDFNNQLISRSTGMPTLPFLLKAANDRILVDRQPNPNSVALSQNNITTPNSPTT